jgi:uncharacterized protein YukE
MPTCPPENERYLGKSRLMRILTNLHDTLEQSRQAENHAEQEFGAWQANWSAARGEISLRLERVESELARLAAQRSVGPKLSIVSEAETGPIAGNSTSEPS